MAYEKKVYSFEDFEKCDLEMIPSLDLPSLIIDELYMPKDGGKPGTMKIICVNKKRSLCNNCGGSLFVFLIQL